MNRAGGGTLWPSPVLGTAEAQNGTNKDIMAKIDKGYLKRKTAYYNYNESAGYLGASGVGVSTGVGDMVEAEIGSLDVVALVATAGDKHSWFVTIPRDMNVVQPLGLKIKFSTASTTAADTHTWITLYDLIAEDSAYAVATTAMNTPHVAASDTDSGVANAWQWSTRAVIDGSTFSETNLTNGDMISINVELDATDASEAIHLIGIQLDYMPKRGQGPVSTYNAGLTDE